MSNTICIPQHCLITSLTLGRNSRIYKTLYQISFTSTHVENTTSISPNINVKSTHITFHHVALNYQSPYTYATNHYQRACRKPKNAPSFIASRYILAHPIPNPNPCIKQANPYIITYPTLTHPDANPTTRHHTHYTHQHSTPDSWTVHHA
jgi:hypothetical protein